MWDEEIACLVDPDSRLFESRSAAVTQNAGKDVQVGKPCSHNIVEGRRLVENHEVFE